MSDPVRGWREQDLDFIREHLEQEGNDIVALKKRIGKKQWQTYASDSLERALESSAYASYGMETEGKGSSTTSTPTLTRTNSGSQIRRFFSESPPTRPHSLSHDSMIQSSTTTTPAMTPTSEIVTPEDRFSEAELLQEKCLYQYFLRYAFDKLYKFEAIPWSYTKEITELAYITELPIQTKTGEEDPESQEYFLARHYSTADASYLKKKFLTAYNIQFSDPRPSPDKVRQKAKVAEEVMANFKDQQLVHKSVVRTNDEFSKRFFKILGKIERYEAKQAFLAFNLEHHRVLHPAEEQRAKEEARIEKPEQSPKPPKAPRSSVTRPTSGEPGSSSKGSPTGRWTPRSQTPPVPIPTPSPSGHRGQRSATPPPAQILQSPNGLRIHRDPSLPMPVVVN